MTIPTALRKLRPLLFLSVSLLSFNSLFGQAIGETQWFFGSSEANLQFDKNGILVYEEERMNPVFGSGGPAVVSNSITGNLALYTDGQVIYDGSGQVMVGSVPLNGDPTLNHTAVVSPTPDLSHRYFVIANASSNSQFDELQYSVVDFSQPGNGNNVAPMGQVTSSNNPLGLTQPSEGLTVIRSFFQPNLYWLLAQNRETHEFFIYQIENDRIDFVDTYYPFNNSLPGFEAADFEINPNLSIDTVTNRAELVIAVAPKDRSRNVILLNMNDTTGALRLNPNVPTVTGTGFSDNAGQSIYDVEWSNDGTKLYMSRYGSLDSLTGGVYQVDFTDTLMRVNAVHPTNVHRSLGLKKAIDGNMYHLYQEVADGPHLLGRFTVIDSSYNQVQYQPQYYDTDFAGTQFPTFAPSNFQSFDQVNFTFLDSCEELATKFFPVVDPPANNYFWNFDDGTGSNSVAPIHTYDQPGNYNVTLTVELNGTIQSFSQPVIIGANDMQINLVSDTTICVDEILTLDPGVDDASAIYQWNTGETSPTIDIDTAGTYWVEIQAGPIGCSKYAEVSVTEYGIQRQIQNKWYFGNQAGIEFTNGPIPLIDGAIEGQEGVATYDDDDGNLMFYTNGHTVWNKEHEIMAVYDTLASGIDGDSIAAQGVMIVPFMDDRTMYYVFTAQEVYGDEFEYDLRYSIVDMKKDSARGAVVLHDLPLFDKSTEKVTVSGWTLNGWLATHEFGNNSFRTNLIDQDGISATIYTPLGEVLEEYNPEEADGYMKFGGGTQFFGNVIPGKNFLEIFDFNNGTGRLENVRQIDTEENGDLYGMEFAPDGSKAYITTEDNRLIQYNLDSLGTDDELQHIVDSKYDGYPSANFGSIQRGTNGVVYVSIDGASDLATIASPGLDGAASNYTEVGFNLGGPTSTIGLPGFVRNTGAPLQPPGMAYIDACFGIETQFFGTGTSTIDDYLWVFYDSLSNADTAGTSNLQNATFAYDTTGMHIFSLNITNRCGFDTLFTDTLEVFTIPEQPMVPDAASLCNETLTLILWDEDRDDLNYYWSTGDTTRTITISDVPSPPSIFSAIINDDGCSSDTLETFVGDGRPALELGADREFCQFEQVNDLDSYNNDLLIHQWTINGTDADTTRYQPVYTSLPGMYEYALYLEDPTDNCVSTDTVEITIREAPDATPTTIAPIDCDTTNGIINLEINSLGSYRYDFDGNGFSSSGSLNGPGIAPSIGGLPIGTYNYTVTDLVTGCDIVHPVLLEDDAPFDLSASNLPDCISDANLYLTVTGLTPPSSINLYITDVNGDTVYSDPGLYVPLTVTPQLDSGIYFAMAEDALNGCTRSDSVWIQPYPGNEINCAPAIHAPNAFSPNGNSQNEEFFVYPNPFVNQFEIFIYSRWGELIYYSDQKNFRWDGKFGDRPLGPATYAYIIKYTSLEEPQRGIITQYGSVTLIK